MKKFLPAGALALLMGSGAAIAQQPAQQQIVTHVRTVNDLAAVCDPAWGGVPRLEAIAYCQGFLTSAGQYHALMNPPGSPVRPLFCVPNPGPTIAQSGVGFARWARENPSYANEPALDGMLRWAQSNFPCPPASPAPRTPRAAR